MISNTDPSGTIPYRGFRIYIESYNETTMVSWWNPYRHYVGYQVVDSPEWADGELLRYAMDNIDRIRTQWNRIDYARLTGYELEM